MNLDIDDDHALACPGCGDRFLHLDYLIAVAGTDQVVIEAAGEDERAHLHVQPLGRYHPLRVQPNSRRHTFSIAGWCEACGNTVVLELRQHKGQTVVAFTAQPS